MAPLESLGEHWKGGQQHSGSIPDVAIRQFLETTQFFLPFSFTGETWSISRHTIDQSNW